MSTTTTALATTLPSGFDQEQMQALAALGYTPGDVMKPTKIALIQPIECTDPESGKIPGVFMDVKSKQTFKKMRIVPLFIGGNEPGSLNARVCFGSQELGSKPICRSNNGVLPVINDDIVRQDGGLGCKKCSKSQWKKIGGKSIKPQCAETINFVFVDEETGFPYKETVKGVNLAPLKDLRDTLRKQILMRVAKKQPVPLYGFVVEMQATKVVGKKGTYYMHSFSAPSVVEDPTQFGSIFEALIVNRGRDFDEEEGQETAENTVNQVIEGQYEEA